jgi:hypothetical protein
VRSSFGTILTIAAPTPNRVGQVLPHAELLPSDVQTRSRPANLEPRGERVQPSTSPGRYKVAALDALSKLSVSLLPA